MSQPRHAAPIHVPRLWIRDGQIRFRDLGVLVAVAAGGQVTVSDLTRHSREGRDAIVTALRRLDACGYVQRAPGRGAWRLTNQAAAQWQAAQSTAGGV
jgi:DNA-binding IclR family transcriptional regulator